MIVRELLTPDDMNAGPLCQSEDCAMINPSDLFLRKAGLEIMGVPNYNPDVESESHHWFGAGLWNAHNLKN